MAEWQYRQQPPVPQEGDQQYVPRVATRAPTLDEPAAFGDLFGNIEQQLGEIHARYNSESPKQTPASQPRFQGHHATQSTASTSGIVDLYASLSPAASSPPNDLILHARPFNRSEPYQSRAVSPPRQAPPISPSQSIRSFDSSRPNIPTRPSAATIAALASNPPFIPRERTSSASTATSVTYSSLRSSTQTSNTQFTDPSSSPNAPASQNQRKLSQTLPSVPDESIPNNQSPQQRTYQRPQHFPFRYPAQSSASGPPAGSVMPLKVHTGASPPPRPLPKPPSINSISSIQEVSQPVRSHHRPSNSISSMRSISSPASQLPPTPEIRTPPQQPPPTVFRSISAGSHVSKRPPLLPISRNTSLSAASAVSMNSFISRDWSQKSTQESIGIYPALLSELSHYLLKTVPQTTQMRNDTEYPSCFSAKQLLDSLQAILPYDYSLDRRTALMIARELHSQMLFRDVDWEDITVRDNDQDLYSFSPLTQTLMMAPAHTRSLTASPTIVEAATPDNSFDFTDGIPNDEIDVPNAVWTDFTKCFSPHCRSPGTTSAGACYAYDCPNRAITKIPHLQREMSTFSQLTVDDKPSDSWDQVVGPDVLKMLDNKEIARQSVMFEVISGEQAYYDDLETLDTAFRQPLIAPASTVLDPAQVPEFDSKVFSNIATLKGHSLRLLRSLQERQKAQMPLVEGIGDLILDTALNWGDDFMSYASDEPFGEALVKEERARNPAFSAFLASRREEAGVKPDFRHFHTRPTVRLQRYGLLLETVLKKTPEEHPDKQSVEEALSLIKEQCNACNKAVEESEMKLAIRKYHKQISMDGIYTDFDLLNPERTLFMHDKMSVRPEGTFTEWLEFWVMLFDHYLLICKPRKQGENTVYRFAKRPIPLELLHVSGFSDGPQIRTTGFHLRSVIGGNQAQRSASIDGPAPSNVSVSSSQVYPIHFRIGGRHESSLTLFVDSEAKRKKWQTKLETAIAIRQAVMDSHKVFDLNLCADPSLNPTLSSGVPMGRILCSVSFVGPTGAQLFAIGCSTGLYIGLRNDPSTLRQVLHQPDVTQCAVLPDHGLFLVMVEKRLMAYLFETLIRSSDSRGPQGPQQVSGNKDILFFRVGKVGDRTLVVYAKRGGVKDTIFKIIEPVPKEDRGRNPQSRFLGMGSRKTEWFRDYKESFIPVEVHSLSFTRKKLAIACAPGFEVMEIDTLQTGSLPNWELLRRDPARWDYRLSALQKRCADSKALAMFRISESEFLFCYDNLAFFADRMGDPLADRYNAIIEWEGRPTTVVFHKPYVIAIDSKLVEIHDVTQNGKLVQLIRGTGIRCTYDGAGISADLYIGNSGTQEPVERRPQIVIKKDNGQEQVFELTPLYT